MRRKGNSTRSVFAPPGKVLMIERNKLPNINTTKSTDSSILKSPNITVNKSLNSSKLKTPNDKKKRKFSQAMRGIREIKKFQKSTSLLIPKASFSRVVREITQNFLGRSDMRFTEMSLMALQEAAEMAIVHLLEIANLCCLHAKRVTLTPADIRLTRRAFGVSNTLNY